MNVDCLNVWIAGAPGSERICLGHVRRKVVMVAEFVIPSLISLKIWEIGVAIDFSSTKLCLAKRNAYQKIKSAFRIS